MESKTQKRVFKNIGVLTGGGDSSGMNAAVRAVTRSAIARGVNVIGIKMAYRGLIDNITEQLTPISVSNIINRGGTFIYSDRCKEFNSPEGVKRAVEICGKLGIDGIVAIGGDGTFRGARDLTHSGIPCIGIPATIDNDITASDYSIGFDTALNTVIAVADRLHDTCESHGRCNIIEIMGRGSGYLALYSGIACGATEIITNEFLPKKADDSVTDPNARSLDEEHAKALLDKMLKSRQLGKRSFLIMVAENMLPVKTTIQETGVVADGRKFPVSVVKLVSYGEALCEYLNKQMELMNSGKSIIETKFMRPSHIQRGGVPTFRDRAISSLMGDKAIDLLMLGKSNLVVCMRKDEITSMDIDFALEVDRLFKGKTTIEALEKDFSADDIEKMKAIVEEKRASFYDIYDVNRTISL